MRRKIPKYLFEILCCAIFLYNGCRIVSTYVEYDTVTRSSQDKQENHPRPMICLSTKNLLRVENEHGQYHWGDWLLGRANQTAEEVYDLVSPTFSDLIKSISIQRTLFAIGEEYEYIDINVTEKETELSANGLLISRCDYYEYLKCYCISLDPRNYTHGVQGFTLSPKIDISTFVVAPGRFYDFSRKLTKIEIENNFSYEYVIDYNIYNLINLHNKPCQPQLSWREDECKLSQLTRLVSSQYNCTSPWFLYFARSQGSSVPVCGPAYSPNVSRAYYESRYRSYRQCENPCTIMGVNTLFTFKSSTEGRQQIKFTFIREIQVTEEKLKVEIETLIANIGGYLGMILGVSLMDLERLVLAVSVLFSRRVGSEDQTEVDRRCENIARNLLKSERAKDKAVENSNKLVQELKLLQDELAKLNKRFFTLTMRKNERIYEDDMSNLLESLDNNIMN